MDNRPTWYQNKINRNIVYTQEHYKKLKFTLLKDEMAEIKESIKRTGMNNREFLENALVLLQNGELDKELEVIRNEE